MINIFVGISQKTWRINKNGNKILMGQNSLMPLLHQGKKQGHQCNIDTLLHQYFTLPK